VQEDKGTLVRNAEITGERQRALALDLVAEDRDDGEVAAERQLMAGEQRPAGDAEILLQPRQRKRGAPLRRRQS
jgi:hypothetical protein